MAPGIWALPLYLLLCTVLPSAAGWISPVGIKALRTSTTLYDKTADDTLWKSLLSRFQGDFDNYRQVVQDREAGMLPREGGGHEHMHCFLLPVSQKSRLAAFYFDGQPQAIFRLRYYRLEPVHNETTGSLSAVDTFLYTLSSELEGRIRACPNPLEWKAIVNQVGSFEEALAAQSITKLEQCEVRWTFQPDPELHQYVTSSDGIHAVMLYGSAIVESLNWPGKKLVIQDQLSLYEDSFWIHDRGRDLETGDFVYGNQRDVPYVLDRVTQIDDNERLVTDTNLVWTLGSEFRTEDEYLKKMGKIGGPSPRKQRLQPVKKG